MPAETLQLRIGNLDTALLITEQASSDPNDALDELILSAADDYPEGERRGGRIRSFPRRHGGHPLVAVHDEARTRPG